MILADVTEVLFSSTQLWTLIYMLKLPTCGILKQNFTSSVRPTPQPEIILGVAEAAELNASIDSATLPAVH